LICDRLLSLAVLACFSRCNTCRFSLSFASANFIYQF